MNLRRFFVRLLVYDKHLLFNMHGTNIKNKSTRFAVLTAVLLKR
jgi:hypothetical protein